MIIIDTSEYLIYTCLAIFFVGIFVNSILLSVFNVVMCVFGMILGGVMTWRVRKLGVSKAVAESVVMLEVQNENLSVSLEYLQEQNSEYEKKLGSMNTLLGIFDTNNKTAEQIQDDMIQTMNKLKTENEKYTKLNKAHAFIVSDSNHDGNLDSTEINVLKAIASDENLSDVDIDNDNKISRKEYMTFKVV